MLASTGYVKIMASLAVVGSSLLYAHQARERADMAAVRWDVSRPIVVEGTHGARESGRAEVDYLRRLVADLND
jgi:hypothetical protein